MHSGAKRVAHCMGRATALALVFAVFAFAADSARATILLFDEGRDASTRTHVVPAASGADTAADYGDNVTGAVVAVPGGFFTYGDGGEGFTPDVTVDLFTSNATPTDPGARLWQAGYGDLVNVVFSDGPGIGGSPQLFVRLSAAPGFVVDLYGFDLAGFGQDYTIAGVSVTAGASTLYSAANVGIAGDASGAGHTSIAFGVPLSAQELLITVDVSNLATSIQDNVAIDNVRFGQTPPRSVPEPRALAFAALAAAALARSRRAR
jgi:hypothetical protein